LFSALVFTLFEGQGAGTSSLRLGLQKVCTLSCFEIVEIVEIVFNLGLHTF
jgi:hypothetical protein